MRFPLVSRCRGLLAVGAIAVLAGCNGGATIGSAPVPAPAPTGPPVLASPTPVAASPTPVGMSPTPVAASPTPVGMSPTPVAASPMPTPTSSAPAPIRTVQPPASPTPVGATPLPTVTPTMTPTMAPTQAPTPAPGAGVHIFVANQFRSTSAATNASITVYPATASGNVAPSQVIQGASTGLSNVQFPAVGNDGTIYASNMGTNNAGTVTAYASGATGNAPPLRTLSGLQTPEGVAFDTAGNMYVAVIDHIYEYAAGASGNTTPIRSIGANPNEAKNNTGLAGPYGITVDKTGNIYVAQEEAIYVFTPDQSGNVAPKQNISGMTAGFASDLAVAVDSKGNIYCGNFSTNTINVYAPGTNGTTSTTSSVITSPNFNQPIGIAIDKNDNIYVANYGNNSVVVIPAGTTGAATGTVISGAMTQIDHPFGIAVK